MAIIRAFMSQRTCCQCFELFTCTVYSITVSKNLKDWINAKDKRELIEDVNIFVLHHKTLVVYD